MKIVSVVKVSNFQQYCTIKELLLNENEKKKVKKCFREFDVYMSLKGYPLQHLENFARTKKRSHNEPLRRIAFTFAEKEKLLRYD